jgi:hypothetical protein
MRVLVLCGIPAAISLLTAPASAGTPYQEDVTCPIGGEKFEHTFTGSYSTFGARPDGKPYGSWIFPMPIPVCPSNKLPIYDEFTKEQLTQLEPLVASAEFKAVGKETPYYRAAWLMERTGKPAADVARMIVRASWEADGNLPLKRRYQEEYTAKLAALPKGGKASEWLWLKARAANGLRELARFPEAVAQADSLIAEARLALAEAQKNRAGISSGDEDEAKSLDHLLVYLGMLRGVAADSNPSAEPVSMLPPMVARSLCKENSESLNASDKAACTHLPSDPES